jgi:hypothetical protein
MEITQQVDLDVGGRIDSKVWQLDARASRAGGRYSPVNRSASVVAGNADPGVVWLLERLAADGEFSVESTVAEHRLRRPLTPFLQADRGRAAASTRRARLYSLCASRLPCRVPTTTGAARGPMEHYDG